ncbi:MAG TPA: hypothetical protein VJX67_11295 [Blastocatellia bacterium]|nr:hypothetical protein [Blastocatellia bacterium]
MAAKGDAAGFADRLADLSFDDLSREDFIRLIRTALKAGAHMDARRLSEWAARRYPDDPEVEKYAWVLSPPRIISSSLPPDSGVEANQAWLEVHAGEYPGQWVALRAGELLGVAPSVKELAAIVGDTKGVLLTAAH